MSKLFTYAIIAIFAGVASVSAHSFNVLLVGPANADSGIYDAFRLATRERDGHANEESEGHLGGLDVYMFTSNDVTQTETLVGRDNIDIVVFLTDSAIVVFLTDRAVEPEVIRVLMLDELKQQPFQSIFEQQDFFARFETDYGYLPSETGQLAYVAAQMIENMVRSGEILASR